MIVSYEIQTFQGGQWKIDSMFDNREWAVAEAERLGRNGKFAAVRVVEERYDDDSGKTQAKVILKVSKLDEGNQAATQRQKEVRQEIDQAKQQIQAKKTNEQHEKARQELEADWTKWTIGMLLRFGGVVAGGFAILFLLRYLYRVF